MQQNKSKFCSSEQKVWKDCYGDEAALCVDAFCHSESHSEEGSRVATESKIYKIKNPETSMVESHPE
jgi:hypothetical protein